ncbi:uncharacterized protein At2g29880-like [Cynara cardunculus var. scolymus]|uniref:uncharacterized protein At2g29880-like n=1 Tax=Cynara cardunculus var. scolymus TaxID=59895 RepID=UPI000D6275EC|nr:uncharacterized protein At2g29880-like [Cynara cardunculus var. scolymus]
MKKDWTIVHDMINGSYTSGFGYDSVKHCVVAEDQVWESYLQVHKGAGKWKNKPFPFYEDLCVVFGKDCATGYRARYFVEAEQEARTEEQTQNLNDESDDVIATSNVQGGNANMQSEETSSTRRKKRKRQVDPMSDGFSNAVTKLGETLEKIANKLSRGVEREDEIDKKRSMITHEILKMQTLPQRDKYKAISLIRDDPEKVNTFWDFQEADRACYVDWVLNG